MRGYYVFVVCHFLLCPIGFYSRRALQVASRHGELPATTLNQPSKANANEAVGDDDLEEDATEPASMDEMVHQAEAIIQHDTHAPVVSPVAVRYTKWMSRHCNFVAMVGLFLIGLSMFGLLYLKPSTKFDDMFPPDSPTIRDMEWLEEHIGPIASVEVLLRFPVNSPLDAYDRLQRVDQVTEADSSQRATRRGHVGDDLLAGVAAQWVACAMWRCAVCCGVDWKKCVRNWKKVHGWLGTKPVRLGASR